MIGVWLLSPTRIVSGTTKASVSVTARASATSAGHAAALTATHAAANDVVYHGMDPMTGWVKYDGITMRNPMVRLAEQFASVGTGKELLRSITINGASGLTRTQARAWEKGLINPYGLPNLYNKMHSIAPKNWSLFGIAML